MTKLYKQFFIVFICAINIIKVSAQEQIDQFNINQSAGGTAVGDYNAQSFTVGKAGQLSKIRFRAGDADGGVQDFHIIKGYDLNKPILETVQLTVGAADWYEVTLSGNIDVVIGDTIFIVWETPGFTQTWYESGDEYAGGSAWTASGSHPNWITSQKNSGAVDYLFESFVIASCLDKKLNVEADTLLCMGDIGTVELPIAEAGKTYTLRDNDTDAPIGSSQIGTGASLVFPIGTMTDTNTFNIFGEVENSSALQLDGVDDYFRFDGLNMPSPTEQSWNFWIKINESSSDQAVIGFYDAVSSGWEVNYYAATKEIIFIGIASGQSEADSAAIPINDNEWTQVSFVHIGGDSLYGYKNGIKVSASKAENRLVQTHLDVQFGKDQHIFSPPLNNLNGSLDEISYWTRALSPSEVLAANTTPFAGSESDLELYFTFNDDFGFNSARDNGQQGHDAVFFNMDSNTVWVNSTVLPPTPCQQELDELITIYSVTPPTIIIDSTESIICGGDSTGKAYITASGGTGSISYEWSNGENTEDVSMLKAGDQSIVITDFAGCTDSNGVNISENPPIAISFTNVSNLNCFEDNSGTVTGTATGGVPASEGLAYTWTPGGSSPSLSGLESGTYKLTITDSLGCVAIDSIELTEPNELTGSIDILNVTCKGDSTGAANLIGALGGTPYSNGNYDLEWSDQSTSTFIQDVKAGNYYLIIEDSLSCKDSIGFAITEPATAPLVEINQGATIEECEGDSAVLSITPKTGYSYVWKNPDLGPSWESSDTQISFLPTTNTQYIVYGTDQDNCTDSAYIDLTIYKVGASLSFSNPTFTASPAGASYKWLDCNNNYAQIGTASGRMWNAGNPGSYAVEVTENGCVDTSLCMSVVIASIENDLSTTVKAYPNPFENNITLDFEYGLNNVEITVTNALGQMTMVSKEDAITTKEISIEGPSGIYFITVSTSEGKAILQVIKE